MSMDGKSSPWKLCLLNSFRVERDGRVEYFFQNRRQEALLAHLALHGDRAVLRKDLARLMWPDKSPSLGANRLTEVLVRLSRLLEEIGMPADTIFTPRRVIQLNPAIATDIVEHDQLCALVHKGLQSGREAQALEAQLEDIYGIGLLPLFTDEWVEPERERLEALQAETRQLLTLHREPIAAMAGVAAMAGAGAFAGATAGAHNPPSRLWPDFDGPARSVEPSTRIGTTDGAEAPPSPVTEAEDPRRSRIQGLVALAEEASIHVWGAERKRWINLLDANNDALLENLEWLLEEEDFDTAVRLCGALWPYWLEKRRIGQGRILLDRVLLAMRPSTAADYARAIHGSGALALENADFSVAQARLEQARQLWQRIGNREWYARALNSLGAIAYREQELAQALSLHAESLEILRSLGQPEILSLVLKNYALDHTAVGQYEEAKSLLVEQLAISRSLDDRIAMASALINLSTVYQHLGQWERARGLAEDCNQICTVVHDPAVLAYCLQVRGYLEHQRGELDEADELYDRSEGVFRSLGDLRCVAELLYYRASLNEDRGELQRAASQLASSRDLFGALRDLTWQAQTVDALAALESKLAVASGSVSTSRMTAKV